MTRLAIPFWTIAKLTYYFGNMKTVVILGSARGEGNTLAAVKELCPFDQYDLIDLRALKINSYSYSGPVGDDDFLLVVEKMQAADNIVFATPVYWYAMSFNLKNFFDRLTDLLSTYKPMGKSLRGKRTFLISTGTDSDLPEGFEVPFRLTSSYFDMIFERSFYKAVR